MMHRKAHHNANTSSGERGHFRNPLASRTPSPAREFVVNVTSSFTVDAAERALAEKADVLITKAGKPLSTVTILFQEPV